MSLVLKQIELSNIRTHKYIKFEPEETGINAISGLSGSGKSSIVDSLAWALYGIKPSGVSKASDLINDQAQLPSDKAYVRAIIKIENTYLKIERRFIGKGGTVECDVWEKTIGSNKDYEHKAGPAVSHSEQYLRKRLNMTAKDYLSTVFVQQKEVDSLIKAGPKERGAVIERLTGVASITAGLEKARQNYNLLKKSVKMSNIDLEELPALEKLCENLSIELQSSKDKKKQLEEKYSTANSLMIELRNNLSQEEKLKNEVEELEKSKVKYSTILKSLEEEQQRVYDMKEEKKKQLSLDSKTDRKSVV